MKIENLPITDALERYPAVGEQLITSTHIKLKIFPEPVRPSIKNWLSDYTFTVGVSNYDPIVRGNYLFKSENGLPLSSLDREKLAIIIKSFEEKMPLAINTNTNQVIFSLPEKREIPQRITKIQEDYQPTQRISQPQKMFESDKERLGAWRRDLPQRELPKKETETENIRFSSPQTLSTEKPIETPRPVSQNQPTWQPVSRINYSTPKRPMPKNVVNLREE
jgi:hypothetical protein